jgi:hypothetical protein
MSIPAMIAVWLSVFGVFLAIDCLLSRQGA